MACFFRPTLSATGGLRLIELRDVCGNVLQHWEYPEATQLAPLTFTLPIATDSAPEKDGEKRVVVVAIDVYGNMLHRTVPAAFQ